VDECKPLPHIHPRHDAQRALGEGRPAQRAHHALQGVVAQVEVESKTSKQIIVLWFQALRSRRFQRGFDRVKLHCRAKVARSKVPRRRAMAFTVSSISSMRPAVRAVARSPLLSST